MIYKSRLWFFLLIFVALGALAFSGKAFFELYQFLSLKESTRIASLSPKYRALSNGQYLLEAHFKYKIGGNTYSGIQKINKIPFKNRWIAEDAWQKLQKSNSLIWYKPAAPEKGILNKAFPFKGVFSSLLLLGITGYFYILGRFMFKFE